MTPQMPHMLLQSPDVAVRSPWLPENRSAVGPAIHFLTVIPARRGLAQQVIACVTIHSDSSLDDGHERPRGHEPSLRIPLRGKRLRRAIRAGRKLTPRDRELACKR